MSELTGVIVFEAEQSEVRECLEQFSDETPLTIAMALISAAGLNTPAETATSSFAPEAGVLFTEATELNPPWFVIEPFGEEWLDFLQVLVQSDTLHFWARLWHEHGIAYYIANADSGRLFRAIDDEDGELEEHEIEQIEDDWYNLLPQAVLRYFEES